VLRSVGIKVLYGLTWLACVALGVLAVVQAYEATRVLSAVLIPKMPEQEVRWQHTIVAVPTVAFILLVLLWIVGSVYLLYVWNAPGKSVGNRTIWIAFAGAVLIELVVIGLSMLIIRQLPLLKLRAI
jgi:hypothetical protein